MREVLIVAGEPSGDAHAAGVARALMAQAPDRPLAGVGGDQMQAAGVEIVGHIRQLAVMGFVAPIRKIGLHVQLLRSLRARLTSGRVAMLVLVDYPDFNMALAASARRCGVPVLYYITPQVWAWRRGRLKALARTVTKAAVILPFEEALLRENGIDATFVGHPLLDRAVAIPDRRTARAALGVPDEEPLLALFPGSRRGEVERHLVPFVETARQLQRRIPGLRVMVRPSPHVTIDPTLCPFPHATADSFTVLRAADVALCKSGTTTLEAAVAACPLAVGYRTSRLEFALAKRLVRIPDIALVNVLAGRRLVPEFVQDALQPSVMADCLQRLIDPRDAQRAAMLAGFDEVRRSLGSPGAGSRVASMALQLADRGRPVGGDA